MRVGGDPYDMAGIVSMCRACHTELHRHDRRELTPDEIAWREFLVELT